MQCTHESADELERYFYTTDEQGSTVFITDGARDIKNEYFYDAFGNVLDSREEIHNRITYTGQQFDSVTQQYYLRARFYNPVIGRFTQEDVYRGDGLNLYAYCRDNPVIYYDPSGYTVCEEAKERQIADSEDKSNIVKRAITQEQAETIRNGQGILKPKPAHKTTPTQHVGGTKHSRNPWTSTTRSSETAEYFATKGGKNINNPNPIIEIDLSKIAPENIVDVSTAEKAAENLTTPFTRNVAAAHQEVLIYGDIPPEAIITKLN